MNRKNLLRKTILITLTLALANCSPQESTRKRSMVDGEFETSSEQPITQADLTEAKRLESILNEVEPIVVGQLSQEKALVDGPMLLQKVITRLRPITLNSEYLMDPANRYLQTESKIQLIPRLVTLFNQAIILTYDANPSLILNTDILAVYKDIIFWDCNQELKGSCEFIKFYRTNDSNNITRIVKMIHDQETDSNEKLRIVKAGFDLKNRRLDDSLRFMLLERIAESFNSERAGTITRERLRQDADLFANIFKINVVNAETSEKYTALIRAVNPWLLSRNIDDPKNPAMTDLIRLGASALIYEGAKLSPELSAAIKDLDYKVGPEFEQGVEFQKENIQGKWKKLFVPKEGQTDADIISGLSDEQKALRPLVIRNPEVELFGEESKKILGNLLSDVVFEKDEYFFLVHQMYYGHYNIDDAAAFWSQTKKDQVRFMSAVMNLIKMQIVNNIVYTNTRMNNFYNNNKNTKLIELLRESDKEGSKIRKAWTKMIARSNSLKSFASRIVSADTPEKRQQLEGINTSVDALAKNIKFLVTYPNMFPLMHVMASLEMKDRIQTFFGTFDIDSQTIIDIFFSGRFAPWFNFGNDGNALDQTEIIYAFHYSLVTEIFKTYSTNQVVQFSPEEFFKVVVKRLILSNEKELDESRRWLTEKKQEYINSIASMKRACGEERSKQAIESQKLKAKMDAWVAAGNKKEDFDWVNELSNIMEPRAAANNQLSFTEIGSSIYDQTSNQPGKIGQYIKTIHSISVSNVFNNMRSMFQTQNTLAKTLLDVYKNYNNNEAIEDVFKEQFEEYNRLKAEYTKLYFEIDEQIDGCEWEFVQRDRDIRQALIFREISYLENLFEEMDQVLYGLTEEERNNLSDEKKAEIETIRKKYMSSTQDSMFPQEYRDRSGYTAYSSNRITTFKMDVYARIKSYLNELFPGQYSITAPANFINESIYRESDPRFIYFDWNMADRKAAKKKFVSSGIQAFVDYTSWASAAPSINEIMNKGDILVRLYKLNKISLNPEIDCHATDLSDEVKAENCKKIDAATVIGYYKRILDFVNIDDRDEIILELIGKESKYSEGDYNLLIKKQDEHKLYSYYDLIFKRIVSDEKVNAAEQTWFMGTLLQYVDSVHKRRGSTFIFPYPDDIEQIFVGNYKAWIDDYFQANIEFIREVKKQIDTGVEPFEFKYRTDRSHIVGQEGNGTLDPLISNLMYGKFIGFTQQMDNDTSRYFSEIFREHKEKINAIINGTEGNQ